MKAFIFFLFLLTINGYIPTPTPFKPEGDTLKEIYEHATLQVYGLSLEIMALIALLCVAIVGFGFGVFKGVVNLFFLSALYYIAALSFSWSTYIATGLLLTSTVVLVVAITFLKED